MSFHSIRDSNIKDERTEVDLERLAPEGLDLYLENVGEEQLEGALAKMMF